MIAHTRAGRATPFGPASSRSGSGDRPGSARGDRRSANSPRPAEAGGPAVPAADRASPRPRPGCRRGRAPARASAGGLSVDHPGGDRFPEAVGPGPGPKPALGGPGRAATVSALPIPPQLSPRGWPRRFACAAESTTATGSPSRADLSLFRPLFGFLRPGGLPLDNPRRRFACRKGAPLLCIQKEQGPGRACTETYGSDTSNEMRVPPGRSASGREPIRCPGILPSTPDRCSPGKPTSAHAPGLAPIGPSPNQEQASRFDRLSIPRLRRPRSTSIYEQEEPHRSLSFRSAPGR